MVSSAILDLEALSFFIGSNMSTTFRYEYAFYQHIITILRHRCGGCRGIALFLMLSEECEWSELLSLA
jgi:hypothetical protein